MNELNLPPSWVMTSLEQMSWIEMGQSPDSSSYNSEGDGLPFFQGKAEFQALFPEIRKWCAAPGKIVERGDILLSIRAPVGPTNIAPARSCIGRGLAGLRGEAGISQKYFFYFLRSIEQWLSQQGAGSTFAAVSGQFVRNIDIPIAPSAEQNRIVEKLEDLLTGLDAGVDELKRAQKKLAQYRQSLLKAAVEGALTAELRANNKPAETGAQLLERILQERRARWEAKQLAKFKEKDKVLPKNWQKKYPEPVQPDTTDLPELPQGWVWVCLDSLINEGPQNGLYLPSDQYGNGTPILRIDDYQIGWHRQRTDLNLVDTGSETIANYALNIGDLVINRVNSMTHLGKCLLIDEAMTGVLFESNMMRLHLAEHCSVNFVAFYLGSNIGRGRLTTDAKWAVNQASINQQDVRRTPIPLPPLVEQQHIAEVLALQIENTERQLAAIHVALKQSTAQRQNILKAAFSGQLVPQDPSDEPASELLERIRAERAAQQAIKKPRGRKVKELA